MNKLVLTLALGLGTAGMAFAQTVADMDADGNGTLSITELQTMYASLTEDGFKAIDTTGDGAIDGDELAAAIAAGTLKADG
jgi:Ca2+-binding EF-hand superfamily protein